MDLCQYLLGGPSLMFLSIDGGAPRSPALAPPSGTVVDVS
jgi:hypothetical protein